MIITGVQIRLIPQSSYGRILAFASVEFDGCFVVHGMRLVKGLEKIFVAMPDDRKRVPCKWCNTRNHLVAGYCNECGAELVRQEMPMSELHLDVCHPITSECRQEIETAVIHAYQGALLEERVA